MKIQVYFRLIMKFIEFLVVPDQLIISKQRNKYLTCSLVLLIFRFHVTYKQKVTRISSPFKLLN